ncbi:RNA polymerase sigma factor [Rhizobium wenxiniae]|uniref:sigma factor-like helix-turn-helix DNA-binding protein n=1 Tax=Rhizobium wenxiniae TaxID=1737357 RepID=UPI001C6F1E7B|nr:sigma factor-like helix-turn-helix DNA-binding protein [Rhizobium wenxiniae]MBW9086526.1 RNA polymerase sigma factor [Rhizobium wenxiniae]
MNPSAASTDIRRDLVALLPRLRRFAQTLTGDTNATDTLVRDVCARVILKSHHWKGECRLESWVFNQIRIGWNEETRKRNRQEPHPRQSAQATDDGSSASKAFLGIHEGLASALLLVDVEGFDYSEAASILGITPELLSSRLCAARLALASQPPGLAERRA